MSTTTPGAAAIAVQARSPLSTVDRRAPPDAAATTLVCDLSRRARRAPTATGDAPLERIVVFLPRRSADVDRDAVERCMRLAAEHSQCRICLVGTFRVHFGDLQAARVETTLRDEFRRVAPRRVSVLRTGHMTTQVASAWSRRFAALYPLLTPAYRSCFVDDDELRETVHGLTDATARDGERVCTLLGTNRPLGDVWRERAAEGLFGRLLTAVAYLLSLLLVGRVISLVYGQIARRRPSWRAWRVDALEPQSFAELLALYNPWNRRHVALAGYNTGVTHFGWKYPGKTVVKTTGCARLVRVHGDAVDVDAGVTIKRVSAELARAGRQPYVVPNYSYVTLGTTFFVPIHGSGSDVSTLGDTIEKVVFYDPSTDRLHAVRRGDPAFDRTMYDLESGVLVLRLRLRVRPQTRYFMRRCLIESPTADDVWECFTDPTAANIEMRKPSASSTAVRLAKFYTAADGADDLLEVPRDSIGRLWDRLEENRLTSALFHGLTRRYAFHVELFLDRDEFEIFWQAHAGLPLLKIQLRFVHHDGLPNSPFGDRDCIAADLFMRRSASPAFLRFVHEKLPHARFNRGKHGM